MGSPNRYISAYTGKQVDEAVKAVNQKANQNLLINGCFINPVNQRGQTEYIASSAGTYSIDCWAFRNTSLASLTIEADGIVIQNNSNTYSVYFEQLLEEPTEMQDTCFALLADEVVGVAYAQVRYTDNTFSPSGGALVAGLKVIHADKSKQIERVLIQVNKGAKIKLRAANLEYGTQQTLAHQDADGKWVINSIPDKTLEAIRCQRYFERIVAPSGANLALGVGVGSSTTLYVPIKIAPKRAASAAFTAEMIKGMRYGTDTLTSVPTSVSVFSADWATGHLMLAVSGTFIVGTVYRFGLYGGSHMDFNSEM